MQGGVRGEARLAGEAGQLVPPGAVGSPQLPGVARVEERGHVLGHVLGEPLRQDGALCRAAPRGRQRLPALDVVVNRLLPSERPLPAAHCLPLVGGSPQPALGEEQEEKEPEQSHVPRCCRSHRHGEAAEDGFRAGGRGAGVRTRRGGRAAARRNATPGPRVTCGGATRNLPSAGLRTAPPPARSGAQPLRRRQSRARLRLLPPRPPRSLSSCPAQRAGAAAPAPGAVAGPPAAPRRHPCSAAPHPSGAAAGEGGPAARDCHLLRGLAGGAAAGEPAGRRPPPLGSASEDARPWEDGCSPGGSATGSPTPRGAPHRRPL